MTGHELRVEDLTVRYGGAVAVDAASLTARSGAVTAVVGPNGAGKTSLLLGVYGSVPARGRVVVDGADLTGLRALARARRGVAVVPQGRQLFPHLTVLENLKVMAETLRLPRGRADAALDRFPVLRTRARSLAGVLSGGEQQMLAISRALMAEPSVLLLDEMTTGLAPKIVQDIARTVAGLADDGVCVLLAEPTIGPLAGLIDRGHVLIRGRVVATAENGGAALDEAYQRAMGATSTEFERLGGTGSAVAP